MKKLFISYALLIFLGFTGAHRFYLNRIYTGVFYLATAGFFGFGIIMDFFMLPFMVSDDINAEGGDTLDIWVKIALCISSVFLILFMLLLISSIYAIASS